MTIQQVERIALLSRIESWAADARRYAAHYGVGHNYTVQAAANTIRLIHVYREQFGR